MYTLPNLLIGPVPKFFPVCQLDLPSLIGENPTTNFTEDPRSR
jgi:hypothetical protein